jgi:hypothetical protein
MQFIHHKPYKILAIDSVFKYSAPLSVFKNLVDPMVEEKKKIRHIGWKQTTISFPFNQGLCS